MDFPRCETESRLNRGSHPAISSNFPPLPAIFRPNPGPRFRNNSISPNRLLSGEELQDDLGKRIAETARKIKTLKSAIEQQNAEVLRIRGEHSRIVCRAAVNEHAAIVGRILKAVEELDAANRAEIECRAGIERAGYSSTLLPPMAFSPQGLDFNTRDVDGGYAPAWARDVADYIQAQALPVETSEKRAIAAALEAAANSRRMPKPAARLSHPGEGEIIG